MRYTLAMVLMVVLGAPAVLHAAFAGEKEGAQPPVPAAVAQSEPADPGNFAAPMAPSFQIPSVEHDLDRN